MQMKLNLYIEANSCVSLFCEGWSSDKNNLSAKQPFHVKLGNPAIADLITARMPCRIEVPGNESLLKGNIRKIGNENIFIIEDPEKTSKEKERV
jgi:hypothetical protein